MKERNTMLNVINSISRLNESTHRVRHYKCPRCSAITEGYKVPDGTEEVCPLCDTELSADDKYYEQELSITPVRESEDLSQEEKDEVQDEIDELEETREEYIDLVSESRLFKARKLLEDTDTTIVVDQDGITDDGDVEEDAISAQKTVEINGEEVKLQVDANEDTDPEYEDDYEYEDDLQEKLIRARSRRRMNSRSLHESTRRMRPRKLPMERRMVFPVRESEELANNNITDAIQNVFIEYNFDVADLTVTTTGSSTTADVIIKGTEDSARAYIDDIVSEIGSRSNMLVTYTITSVDTDLVALALKFEPKTVTEDLSDEASELSELIDDVKEEIADNVEEVIESHRRRYRNAVLREALASDEEELDLSDKEDIEEEGEELKDDLESAVESAIRRYKSRLLEYRIAKSESEKMKDSLIKEVEELTESAIRKRASKRRRLVESTNKYTIEDVIDDDEDILDELEDQVNDAAEEILDDSCKVNEGSYVEDGNYKQEFSNDKEAIKYFQDKGYNGEVKTYDTDNGCIGYIPADKASELGLKPESVQ